MIKSEIEKPKTTFSLVVGNRRFPVDNFYINVIRQGCLKIGEAIPNLIDRDSLKFLIHQNMGFFDIWDYSRERTIWHLHLEAQEEYDDYDIFYFEYKYTSLERIVAELLRQKGINFLMQVPIGIFVVDFYIMPDTILEVDGPHHENEDIRKKDQYKDEMLRLKGFKVERISYFMTEGLSLDIVSEVIPSEYVNETSELKDIKTRIEIILAVESRMFGLYILGPYV
ncbi:MAG: endonuclease domain-containing protein [Methanothrix sp.]|jgi:very-short-patch-repair endonuclease|nr:endonuclease domain-containing protein [Methanothrix sp.]